jgi:hypothetical protein
MLNRWFVVVSMHVEAKLESSLWNRPKFLSIGLWNWWSWHPYSNIDLLPSIGCGRSVTGQLYHYVLLAICTVRFPAVILLWFIVLFGHNGMATFTLQHANSCGGNFLMSHIGIGQGPVVCYRFLVSDSDSTWWYSDCAILKLEGCDCILCTAVFVTWEGTRVTGPILICHSEIKVDPWPPPYEIGDPNVDGAPVCTSATRPRIPWRLANNPHSDLVAMLHVLHHQHSDPALQITGAGLWD